MKIENLFAAVNISPWNKKARMFLHKIPIKIRIYSCNRFPVMLK